MKRFSIETGLKWRKGNLEDATVLQAEWLQDHIRQAGKAPFYKELLHKVGCRPEDIKSVNDIRHLPFTFRKDLDDQQSAFQAVSDEHVADIALTSGTTGNSVQVPYTKRDLERLAFNEAMAFLGTGASPSDRYLLCVTIDRCFIAGLAYYSGLVKLGAAVIRSGPGQPARQWELIRQLKPNGIVGVPSFLLKMAKWGTDHGLDPAKANIRSLVTVGEPVRKPDHSLTPLARDLCDAWDAPVFSSYGATEFETAFCECSAQQGGHVHPELMLTEIVDDAGNVLPDGEPGEVVVTPLGVEGFPLVRFRTGDIARLHAGHCSCGWQTPRLGAIEGRLAQRLKYKGTTLYPEMIFHVLQEIKSVETCYVEVRSAADQTDEVRVVVGSDAAVDTKEITDFLQARLRVCPEVHVKDKSSVVQVMEAAGGRKLQRFFDFR